MQSACRQTWLLNKYEQVFSWDWDGMNGYNQRFHSLETVQGESVIFADYGF